MIVAKSFNGGQILLLTSTLVIGMITGWLGFILFGDFASNTTIVYVSAKEVLKLEKERIENSYKESAQSNDEGKDTQINRVFYGYPDQALKLIEKLAKGLTTRQSKVIFVNENAVRGDLVKSVSKDVHAKVLKIIDRKLKNNSLEGLK